MVAADREHMEVNSPVTANTRSNDNADTGGAGVSFPFQALGRQASIYSLTLDEFQNTIGAENGKNFGSMNMDEFLNSIWTAEENQNQNQHQVHHQVQNVAVSSVANTLVVVNTHQVAPVSSRGLGLAKQPSLARQGSLTLPAPLCQKTVDEVWSEIQRGGVASQSTGPTTVPGPAHQRTRTFGEMTLEDFLIKAGVVRDAGLAPPPPPPPAPAVRHQPAPPPATQYGMYQNGNNNNHHPQIGPSFGPTVPGGYPTLPQNGGETSGKRNNGYIPVGPAAGVCYGGGGGYGAGLGMTSPVSPLGGEGLGDGALRARKRNLDGPVEKVVERRQRRMIKNRESAARSRARKQAYTVELEAELNQLREENSQLKQALAELERQRNEQYEEQLKELENKTQKTKDDKLTIKRSSSWPL